jgi:hypothetical protein
MVERARLVAKSAEEDFNDHSMLMFMNPSFVSVIPCKPTRFRGPVWLGVDGFRLPFSVLGRSGKREPMLALGGPQMLVPISLTAGELGMTGLL